jgi:hypothetical protein
MQNIILIVGPNCWGKGENLATAFKAAKANISARAKFKPNMAIYEVYSAPSNAYVNDMGGINFTLDADHPNKPFVVGHLDYRGIPVQFA